MKKKIVQLSIVAVLLIGALVAFLVLQKAEPVEEEVTEAAESIDVLGGIPQPFVKSVSVQNELDSFTVINGFENAIQQMNNPDSALYELEGLPTDTLNQSLLKTVVTLGANLTATKIVKEDAPDLSIYGLASPKATVKVQYEDKEATMLVGDVTPGDEGTYVLVDKTVYLVATNRLTNILGSRLELVTKTVTPTVAQDQPLPLEKLVLTGGRFGSEPVVMEKAPEDSEAHQMMNISTINITQPISTGLDSNKGLEYIATLFGITGDKVEAYISDSAELDQYGLAPAYLTAAVETSDEEIGSFTVSFSQPDAEGYVNVFKEGGSYVYKVSAANITILDKNLFDLREKMLILPYIDSVGEIELKTTDTMYTFKLDGEGDDLKVTLNDKEIDTKNFRAFYQTMIAASYSEEMVKESVTQLEELVEGSEAETEAETSEVEASESSEQAEQSQEESQQPPEESSEAETETEQPAEQEADAAANSAEGDVFMQITYRYRDSSPANTVYFAVGPARKTVIWLDDTDAHYTRSTYTDFILENIIKLYNGENVKSYL